MEYENTFVREVKEHNMTDPFEILNWYRNLYHTEDNHTEHGIMAYAINDAFMAYKNVVPNSEVESLQVELDAMRGAANSYKMHYESAKAEVAKEIFQKIKNELREAIKNNYRVIHEHIEEHDEINAELDNFTYGKILALDGMLGFIEHLEVKYENM